MRTALVSGMTRSVAVDQAPPLKHWSIAAKTLSSSSPSLGWPSYFTLVLIFLFTIKIIDTTVHVYVDPFQLEEEISLEELEALVEKIPEKPQLKAPDKESRFLKYGLKTGRAEEKSGRGIASVPSAKGRIASTQKPRRISTSLREALQRYRYDCIHRKMARSCVWGAELSLELGQADDHLAYLRYGCFEQNGERLEGVPCQLLIDHWVDKGQLVQALKVRNFVCKIRERRGVPCDSFRLVSSQ